MLTISLSKPLLANSKASLIIIASLLLGACSSLPFIGEKETFPERQAPTAPVAKQAPAAKDVQDPGFIGLHDRILQLAKFKRSNNLWDHIRKDFDLPQFNSSRVRFYEKQFSRNPAYMKRVLSRAKWFLPSIYAEIKELNYPAELALLPAIESAYKTDALSRTGASGLWQFIRSTGRIFGMRQNWWYDGRRDPALSTSSALKYLGQLNKRFDGDWLLAIAGYNAGGRTIERAVEKNQKARKPAKFQHLRLRKETRDYIPKLIAWRNIIAKPEKFGIELPDFPLEAQYVQINAGSQINISLVSKLIGAKPADIRFLNSAYKHGVTPPDGPHWIYVPSQYQKKATAKLAKLSRKDRMAWRHHKVEKGEALGRIANQYQVSVASIKKNNHLKGQMIHPGDILLIPTFDGQTASKSIAMARSTASASQSSKKSPQKAHSSKVTGKLTHRIKSGDTLWEIAKRYGVKVADLSRWNAIRPTQTLKLGDKLVIYTKRT